MTKTQSLLIKKILQQLKVRFQDEASGHDFWHIFRVYQMAKTIARKESADIFVVSLAALLHDIADWKFHRGDDSVGPKMARRLLQKEKVDEKIIDAVCQIIAEVSFKGARVKTVPKTFEGKIVQDADRLDAIGAIGIARAFAYGGYRHRPLYNPNQKPVMHRSKKAYFNSQSATINHFYEKLFLLKDRMHTKTAKKIARERHRYMKDFVKRFFKEWNEKA